MTLWRSRYANCQGTVFASHESSLSHARVICESNEGARPGMLGSTVGRWSHGSPGQCARTGS
ncbi:hypothetical protein J6590_007173 [Homalodisca vitripennis]|nr:hypothetical protein J6590_007173 [Homalodisca vitripennis]